MRTAMDLMHKTASPKTYPCKLCQITYSGVAMKKMWKNYISSLNIHSVFLHKNEFEQTFPHESIKYPAVLLSDGKSLKTILSSEDFEMLRDLGDLIKKLNERLPNVSKQ